MKDPTAIVTGASSGLGLELAIQLIKGGYRTVGVARHRPTDSRWGNLEGFDQARFLIGDVSRIDTAIEALALARQLGTYKLLINSAGQGVFGDITSFTEQDVHNVMAGSLIGLIHFCTQSIPALLENGGTIVNILSTAATHTSRPSEAIYCAAKWGARGYTEALRLELRGKSVRVLAVYPAGMNTPFWRKASGPFVDSASFMDPSEVAREILGLLFEKRTLQVTEITFNKV
jgi:short-subunit dehydrogenase